MFSRGGSGVSEAGIGVKYGPAPAEGSFGSNSQGLEGAVGEDLEGLEGSKLLMFPRRWRRSRPELSSLILGLVGVVLFASFTRRALRAAARSDLGAPARAFASGPPALLPALRRAALQPPPQQRRAGAAPLPLPPPPPPSRPGPPGPARHHGNRAAFYVITSGGVAGARVAGKGHVRRVGGAASPTPRKSRDTSEVKKSQFIANKPRARVRQPSPRRFPPSLPLSSACKEKRGGNRFAALLRRVGVHGSPPPTLSHNLNQSGAKERNSQNECLI